MSKPPPRRSPHSLGKRLLPAVVMTASATGLIALLDRPSSGSIGDALGGPLDGVADGPGGDPAAVDPAAGNPAGQPPDVSSTLPTIVGGDDGGSGEDSGEDDNGNPIVVAPTRPTQATQPSTTVPPQPAAASGPCEGQTIDGPSVNTRWGPVQVEAVVSSAGQICDVGAIRSPDSHRRSVSINEQALPILHDQVMKAQSAHIRGVSGATVTSAGYVRSLQAILDGSAG
ncbi:MAG TPA: FMN-binding protein [Ilumatobacteraceae bacterium]|nr:FMN-binding protein [Ilumatobacteraceae bacterium]